MIIQNEDGSYLYKGFCVFCQKPSYTTISAEGYKKWIEEDNLVQDAFPNLSKGDREILISGTHSDCWDKAFKEKEC
jgi:hypothetical protein